MNRYIRAHGRSFSIPTFGPAFCDDPTERLAVALIVTPEPLRRHGFLVRYNLDPGALDLGLARSGRAPILLELDLPPGSGGMGSERHAAWSMVTPSMLALASAGVR